MLNVHFLYYFKIFIFLNLHFYQGTIIVSKVLFILEREVSSVTILSL